MNLLLLTDSLQKVVKSERISTAEREHEKKTNDIQLEEKK